MSETQKSIHDWSVGTFGQAASNARIGTRANQEMSELLAALTKDDSHPKALEECADVVIVLFRLAEHLGGDLLRAVDEKMAINRERKWTTDHQGIGYHHADAAAHK